MVQQSVALRWFGAWTLQPKSEILISPGMPTRMFSGLMSRWMTCFRCRYRSADAIWAMYWAAFHSGKRFSRRRCLYSSPLPANSRMRKMRLLSWKCPYILRMLGCRRLLWISISRRTCFSTPDPCCSSDLYSTLSAQMKPLVRSRARYTRPNLPFPSGRPISNMPRWNCLGIEAISSSTASSSELRDDDDDDDVFSFFPGEGGLLDTADCFHWAACDGSVTVVVTVFVV